MDNSATTAEQIRNIYSSTTVLKYICPITKENTEIPVDVRDTEPTFYGTPTMIIDCPICGKKHRIHLQSPRQPKLSCKI